MMYRFFNATASGYPADWDGKFVGHMFGMGAMNPAFSWVYTAMHIITWVLVVAILVALLRWLWKKGN